MIGSLFFRGLVMIFGYIFPAYECYKTVENNKGDAQQLRFWCQYWILVALLTVWERIGDAFVSWLPMYGEAKLAFFIYLWYPKTKGTEYVYDSFFRPYLQKHEKEIDRCLMELKTKAGDTAAFYFQKVGSYVQMRGSEILLYVASQSTLVPKTKPKQREEKDKKEEEPVLAPKPAQDTGKTAVFTPTNSTPVEINTAQQTGLETTSNPALNRAEPVQG